MISNNKTILSLFYGLSLSGSNIRVVTRTIALRAPSSISEPVEETAATEQAAELFPWLAPAFVPAVYVLKDESRLFKRRITARGFATLDCWLPQEEARSQLQALRVALFQYARRPD